MADESRSVQRGSWRFEVLIEIEGSEKWKMAQAVVSE